jgi:WXG100 family type VII secretion target
MTREVTVPDLEVDEGSIRSLITAFDHTRADCNAAQAAVDGTSSYLRSTWTGEASARFASAIGDWQAGLNKVKAGLDMINEQMAQYHRDTGVTEDTAISSADWMPAPSWT